jgi:sugar-specific transcriptional regulator TrmB
VIKFLKQAGPSTPAEVKQALKIKASGYVYSLLSRLQSEGLVEREDKLYSAVEGEPVPEAKTKGYSDRSKEAYEFQIKHLEEQVSDLHVVVRYLEHRLDNFIAR